MTNTGSVVGTPQGPGNFGSIDQMIAGSPGLIPFNSGCPSAWWYKSVTMWVDHFPHFLHAHCQKQATIQSTFELKENFELFAKWHNVQIKHIHSDNGVFMMKAFKDHITTCNEQQSFCNVGTHWQNGVIEQYIGVITACAHTMLLHAMQMWPNVISLEFWSYTFMHVVHLHNCTPQSNEKNSLFTLFTDKDPTHTPNDFKVFGSPVYILDSSLQTGLVLENRRNNPTRVYTLVICHTMQAMSSLSTIWRLDWCPHNITSFMMNHSRLSRFTHLRQMRNKNWMRC